ncbi:MAG: tetratricopeptide repeat protein [Candidatus Shapirobacteria bacterium]|nr:tetratricopeptide repeat protein [Candidatus Shapirobacteria bacterium]
MGETLEGATNAPTASRTKSSLTMKYLRYWLALIIFLVPLVFVPFLYNVYFFPKVIVLLLGVVFGWLGLLLPAIVNKSPDNNQTVFFGDKKTLLFSLILILAFVVSSLLQPNVSARINAFSGTTAVVLGGFLLMLLLKQVRGEGKEAGRVQGLVLGAFTASAMVLSLVTIFQYTGLLARFFTWEAFSVNTWTPTGSLLTSVILMFLALVYVLINFLKSLKNNFRLPGLIGLLLLLIILALGIIMGVITLIESEPILISLQNAWIVAVENFKSFVGAAFGVGPDNFRIAYARFRPITVNNTTAWALYFSNSFNHYLNLLTEVGLLGCLGFLGLVIVVWRQFTRTSNRLASAHSEIISLLLLVIALFIPFDINLWLIFFVLLGLVGLSAENRGVGLGEIRPKLEMNRYLLLTIMAGVLLLSSFWYGRVVWADVLFARSVAAFNRGEGGNAYNWQIEALEKNPHSDAYRLGYAQTNLALASAFSQNENLTEQDQQQIAILIQQAIREAKSAVAISPFWSSNWVNLAGIYRQVIGVAQEAEQWAIESLRQAIALDPVNPNLRIELGGLYYALGNFELAQRQFETAVDLKPDHANAHYNLAATYVQQEKWANAVLELQTVLSLVEPGSNDFNQVQEELNQVKERLPQQEAVEGEEEVNEQLQQPQPLPKPQFEPIDLPAEEAAPPQPVLEEPEESRVEETTNVIPEQPPQE